MIDFAGSGVVHMVGGFSGLMGSLALVRNPASIIGEITVDRGILVLKHASINGRTLSFWSEGSRTLNPNP